MSEVYWYFLQGFLTVTAVFVVILLVKLAKDKFSKKDTTEPPEDKTPLPFASAMMLVGGAAILFSSIAFVLYIWIVPISSYEGKVQGKVRPVATKGGWPVPYYVMIESEKRKISRNLFLSVKRGDHLRHPFAAPYFYRNEKLVPNEEVLWSLGFYGGICLYLFGGFSIFVLGSITPEDKPGVRGF
jgi:hypothetical protein